MVMQKDADHEMAPTPPYQVGDLIWFKVNNSPWWPAKILARRDDKREYYVDPFGDDNEYASAREYLQRRGAQVG